MRHGCVAAGITAKLRCKFACSVEHVARVRQVEPKPLRAFRVVLIVQSDRNIGAFAQIMLVEADVTAVAAIALISPNPLLTVKARSV